MKTFREPPGAKPSPPPAPPRKIYPNIRDLPKLTKRQPRFRVVPKSERTANGIVFASKAEMLRYAELVLLRSANKIKEFFGYQSFDLAGVRYTPDFTVYGIDGERWCEEVKGRGMRGRFRQEALRQYRRNAKQMLTIHGVEVRLVEM